MCQCILTEDTLYSSLNIPRVRWQCCSGFEEGNNFTIANGQCNISISRPPSMHDRKLDIVPFLSLTVVTFSVLSFPCFLLYPTSLSWTVVSVTKFVKVRLAERSLELIYQIISTHTMWTLIKLPAFFSLHLQTTYMQQCICGRNDASGNWEWGYTNLQYFI